MSKLTFILSIITLTFFTSCDCMQNVSGTIVDADTNQPIEGVHVQKENKDYDKDETDQNGYFTVESISGGPFGCPPMTVVVSKDGYKTLTLEIDNAGHETIKLKRTTE